MHFFFIKGISKQLHICKKCSHEYIIIFFYSENQSIFFIARVAKISLALFEVILYTFFRVWLTNYPSDKNDPTLLAISVLV